MNPNPISSSPIFELKTNATSPNLLQVDPGKSQPPNEFEFSLYEHNELLDYEEIDVNNTSKSIIHESSPKSNHNLSHMIPEQLKKLQSEIQEIHSKINKNLEILHNKQGKNEELKERIRTLNEEADEYLQEHDSNEIQKSCSCNSHCRIV